MAVTAGLRVDIHRKQFSGDGRTPPHVAIENLQFTVPVGQFCCLLGPSGCGKTTLLNIVAGLDDAVDGSVHIGGEDARSRQAIGYMFQTPRLLPWMSVRDNVDIVLGPEARAEGRGAELLQRMELGAYLDAYPTRLSGGQRRRVALARAFAVRPALLLLDEPFVSLDQPVGNRLREILLDLWQAQPTTVLFVTHDLNEAIFLGDRIVFLSRPPSSVLHDAPVKLARPRTPDGPDILDFRADLLDRQGGLLAGTVGSSPDSGPSAP